VLAYSCPPQGACLPQVWLGEAERGVGRAARRLSAALAGSLRGHKVSPEQGSVNSDEAIMSDAASRAPRNDTSVGGSVLTVPSNADLVDVGA